MDEKEKAFFISTREGIGTRTFGRLLEAFGTIENIYNAAETELDRVEGISRSCIERLLDKEERKKAQIYYQKLNREGIFYCYYSEEMYPERLRQLYDFPPHLFFRGTLPEDSVHSIGIVGARDCSYYGRDMARLFGYRLAQAGLNVISGMAKGIDGWAHQGALESGGKTYAVLGCGADVCYPSVHRHLYDSLIRCGGVLSEFMPGTKAKSCFFPMRNRIISALSDGILVVEAREKSGSLITADAALEQGKDVFVVPGRIGDFLSVGCNRLIRQGAIPVLSPGDILSYYGVDTYNKEENLNLLQQKLLVHICDQPISLHRLQNSVEETDTEVLRELLRLKKMKVIRELPAGYYIREI